MPVSSFQRRVREAFSQAATTYDMHAQIQAGIQQELLAIAGNIYEPHAHILDMGCGTGNFASQSHALGHHWQITQSDFAPGMCERAQQRNPDTVTVCADAQALPFHDHTFDGIFSCLMLQWVSDPQRAFAEMFRVVKPGGQLVAASFGPGSLKELKASFGAVGEGGKSKALPTAEEMQTALENAGWSVSAVQAVMVTEIYPEVWDLIKHLKQVGANQRENPAPIAKERLNAMADYYHGHFSEGYGIRCSWEVVIMLSTTA